MCSASRNCNAAIVSSTGARAPLGNASISEGYAVESSSAVYEVTKPSTLPLKNPVSKSALKIVSCDMSSLPTALPIDCASRSRWRGIIPCGQTVRRRNLTGL